MSERNNDGGTSDAVVEGQGEFSSHETHTSIMRKWAPPTWELGGRMSVLLAS